MQLEAVVIGMGILIDVIDPGGVEQRGTALDAMHLVALFQKEFGQIGAVLTGDAGDAGDECFAGQTELSMKKTAAAGFRGGTL